MKATPARLITGAVLGALVYAAGGALGAGVSTWLWAALADNAETNSEATGWLVVGLVIGAIAFAPFGAVAGFVERSTGKWMRSSWVLPLIGLLLGVFVAASAWDEVDMVTSLVLWPPLGVFCGLLVHGLFALIVATDGSPT